MSFNALWSIRAFLTYAILSGNLSRFWNAGSASIRFSWVLGVTDPGVEAGVLSLVYSELSIVPVSNVQHDTPIYVLVTDQARTQYPIIWGPLIG